VFETEFDAIDLPTHELYPAHRQCPGNQENVNRH